MKPWIVACVVLAVGAPVGILVLRSQTHASASRPRFIGQDRVETAFQIDRMIQQREFVAARALAQASLVQWEASQPVSEYDRVVRDSEIVGAHRQLGKVHRLQREFESAKDEIMAARAVLDASPVLQRRVPGLKHVLSMDLAEIAAFGEHDTASAVALWDGVVADRDHADPVLVRVAMQNAAAVTARPGLYAEASARIDALIAASPDGPLSREDLAKLRVSQANYAVLQGDLAGAAAKSTEIWNQFQDLRDPNVFAAAVQAVHWLPVPSQCEARSALARSIYTRLDQLRQADGSVPIEFRDVESQLATALWDSRECAALADLVVWAEGRRVRAQW